MPHLLDFRQAFSSPGEPAPPVVESEAPLSHSEADTPPQQRQALGTRLPRLYRSDRTTILFAIFAFAGGLFCAFYFFNGGEFLRAAAAWSREFLYPRPSRFMAENAKIDNFKPKSDSWPAPPAARRQNTSPFRSDLGSLYPPTFNDPSSTGSAQATLPSGPGSLLDQLNIPPPGGDALLQSLNRAVDNLARVTTLFANSTATVQTTVKQAPVNNAQLKSAAQNASNVAAQNLSAKQNAQKTSRTLNRRTQAITSTVRTLDLRQHGGSGIQGVLGPGDALGSGAGLGGVGGGMGEGAVGGAMGAAGGAVGGLTGGH
jgi:ribosomal protein L9